MTLTRDRQLAHLRKGLSVRLCRAAASPGDGLGDGLGKGLRKQRTGNKW